ncbi:hypothetical protein ACH427_08540 [Streptomyces sp. NPDC020379]|uniref:hypothetical protein n=1 Tax=Streptomyces sp. NPDC020379 TaxID=3365071 RepID=UPI0037883554
MPSVLGLLEARQMKVREEVARLREEAERVQAALDAAERAFPRLADTRETVAEVLAGPPAGETGQAQAAVARSTVPHRAPGGASAPASSAFSPRPACAAAPRGPWCRRSV